MIKTELLVPSNYYTRSRDFQLLGRILDCVFNNAKGYSDMVKYDSICKNTDRRLLDLITRTIGFESKRQYDTNDLFILCSAFKDVLQRKGTIGAVEDCVRILLKSQNIDKPFAVYDVGKLDTSNTKKYCLEILVPEEMSDIALLEDMLDYILPAGYIYTIISTAKIYGGINSYAAAVDDSTVDIKLYKNSELGHVYKGDTTEDSEKTELSVVYRNDDSQEE